jgi:hypothetical protein
MFDTLDVNCDGKILQAEFIKGLRKYPQKETALGLSQQEGTKPKPKGTSMSISRHRQEDRGDIPRRVTLDRL